MSSTTLQSHVAVTEQEASELALEAYVYLYPLVLMETTRRQACNVESAVKTVGRAPINEFAQVRMYPPADFKDVVRPNFDTLYSVAWVDLTDEPAIISMPDTNGRYYLLPFLDMWTDVFAVPGWRTSGTQAQEFALIPPGWQGQIPAGITRIQAPTKFVWVIGRTKTDGPADYAAVHAIQDAMKIETLSGRGKTVAKKATQIDANIDMKTPPMVQVDAMSGQQFFELAAELMCMHAPHETDWSQVERLRRLGIEAGKKFEFAKAAPQVQAAIEKSPEIAQKLLKGKISLVGRPVNGWQLSTSMMGVYGNNYVQRAIVALVGLGANQPEDAIYPLNVTDADGHTLNGKNKYVLRFEANEIPPVNAFWSLTLYDAQGFACANVLDRHAISSWMPLVKNADGSVELYIQSETPGAEKEANWLPSIKDEISLVLRLYAPKASVLNGDWVPPVIRKV